MPIPSSPGGVFGRLKTADNTRDPEPNRHSIAPVNRPGPKRKFIHLPSIRFSGFMLVLGRVKMGGETLGLGLNIKDLEMIFWRPGVPKNHHFKSLKKK